MLVTLELATEVLKLRRQHVTVAKMAEALGRSETEILDAHCMLGIAIADWDDEPPRPRLSGAGRQRGANASRKNGRTTTAAANRDFGARVRFLNSERAERIVPTRT